MKKHLVLIVNVILIIGILCGVGYAVYRASFIKPEKTKNDVATVDEPTAPPIEYDIGIIQHSDVDNCNNVYQGFIAELASNGYVNGNNINLDYVLEEDNAKCEAAIQRFVDEEYDLIFAIGPFATRIAASKTADIPIVFGAISEPEKEEYIKSNENPSGNVTGVCDDYTHCFEQIDSIKMLFPKCKKIGAIYTATSESSVTQALIGEKEAQMENINIPYAKYPVENAKEIAASLDVMKSDGVDVIYAPVDGFVNKNLKTIVDFSYKNGIPIVCGNLTMLEKGCFSTSVINYASVGCAAGDMTLDILTAGAKPSDIPIAYISECYLHINKEAMEKLKITLPDEIKETALIE